MTIVGKTIWGAIAGILVIVAVICASMFISLSNKEITLKNLVLAQQKNAETVFDKVWKTIKQKSDVTDKYKDSFKEIFVNIMDQRYQGDKDGSLMKWVTESNPNFDASLFKDLMSTIEANRAEFQVTQKVLIDYNMQHTNLIETFPGSLFLGSRSKIEIQLVTSKNTKEAFKTGEENL